MTYCVSCGKMIEQWDTGYYVRDLLCMTCYDRKKVSAERELCVRCASFARKDPGHMIDGHFFCDGCYAAERKRAEAKTCKSCRKVLEEWEQRQRTPDGSLVCNSCYTLQVKKAGQRTCPKCGAPVRLKMRADGKVVVEHQCQVEEAHEAKSTVFGLIRTIFKRRNASPF